MVGTVASLPFENIRIRIMNLYADQALNRLDYTKHVPEKNKITIYGVIRTSIRTEGVNCFFVGMYPHFLHVLGYSFLVRKTSFVELYTFLNLIFVRFFTLLDSLHL